VKSFNSVGTKYCGLTMMDMSVDTSIHGFQIILNISKVNKYFLGILSLWVVLPRKYTKVNFQHTRGPKGP